VVSILENWKKRGAGHPVVISLKSREEIKRVFVVVEYQAVPILRSLVGSVDEPVKIQFRINKDYAAECTHFFQ
jgi:hypothetical protein